MNESLRYLITKEMFFLVWYHMMYHNNMMDDG